MPKYTEQQIVRGINHFASQTLGSGFELSLDQSLAEHYTSFVEMDECPLMFLEELAEYFGFAFSERQALGWLRVRNSHSDSQPQRRFCVRVSGVECRRTGRDLVRLVMRRAECPNFSPRNLFGSRCAKAGCFLGIHELIRSKQRIAPSTRIRDVLSEWEYGQLIERLEWMFPTSARLGDLRPTRHAIDNMAMFVAIVFSFFAGGLVFAFAFPINAALSVCAGVLAMIFGAIGILVLGERLKRALDYELCDGVSRFRDLVENVINLDPELHPRDPR